MCFFFTPLSPSLHIHLYTFGSWLRLKNAIIRNAQWCLSVTWDVTWCLCMDTHSHIHTSFSEKNHILLWVSAIKGCWTDLRLLLHIKTAHSLLQKIWLEQQWTKIQASSVLVLALSLTSFLTLGGSRPLSLLPSINGWTEGAVIDDRSSTFQFENVMTPLSFLREKNSSLPFWLVCNYCI